tara:strand:- start:224 stop:418 length:195 start_codon:yes stop_codon:yes gene_type:complete
MKKGERYRIWKDPGCKKIFLGEGELVKKLKRVDFSKLEYWEVFMDGELVNRYITPEDLIDEDTH